MQNEENKLCISSVQEREDVQTRRGRRKTKHKGSEGH